MVLIGTMLSLVDWGSAHRVSVDPTHNPFSSQAAVAGVLVSPKTPGPTPNLTPQQGRNVVLMVLDGAQPALFRIPNIPHIRALMRNGVQYTNAWAGILESET